MGPYLYFRVLIFTFLASFTQRMSIQSACIQLWFKLLANFDFYALIIIYTSSFWVLIGSLSQSLGVFISFRGSAEASFCSNSYSIHIKSACPFYPPSSYFGHHQMNIQYIPGLLVGTCDSHQCYTFCPKKPPNSVP